MLSRSSCNSFSSSSAKRAASDLLEDSLAGATGSCDKNGQVLYRYSVFLINTYMHQTV